MLTNAAITSILAVVTIAAPSNIPNLTPRASSCSQYDSTVIGRYTVYNNLWGEDSASSGSQCYSVDSLNCDLVAWETAWTWFGGPNSVKSYANAVIDLPSSSLQLSSLSSIESSWTWNYTGSDIVADVAYDMFTSSTAGGEEEYEVVVWLAAIGHAGPISSANDENGKPTPAASNVQIAGQIWSLYKGPNGETTVFSFLPANKGEVKSFAGDLMHFYSYLESAHGLPSSQYLLSVGAGTEAFSGTDAKFIVSQYSAKVG